MKYLLPCPYQRVKYFRQRIGSGGYICPASGHVDNCTNRGRVYYTKCNSVYFLVVLTAVPIVGLTSIIAAYAKNYKEAGIGISFAYIMVVGVLIVPALTYISRKSYSANFSPMTTVMRLFTGEAIPLPELLMSMIFVILMSILTFLDCYMSFSDGMIFYSGHVLGQ